MVALRKHAPLRMTLPEFLSWEPRNPTDARWQLVDGEPVAMAPGSETHGALQAEIGALLRNHLLATARSCRLITEAGIVPRIRANRNFRIPDLAVTCAPPGQGIAVPDPVLLVEILSPGNEAQTRANIWAYTTIPSVQDILAIHSTRVEAELLTRLPDGSWPAEPDIIAGAGSLTLTSIGYTTPLTAFYRTTAFAS
jgi:Uma2 family endonuclease